MWRKMTENDGENAGLRKIFITFTQKADLQFGDYTWTILIDYDRKWLYYKFKEMKTVKKIQNASQSIKNINERR